MKRHKLKLLACPCPVHIEWRECGERRETVLRMDGHELLIDGNHTGLFIHREFVTDRSDLDDIKIVSIEKGWRVAAANGYGVGAPQSGMNRQEEAKRWAYAMWLEFQFIGAPSFLSEAWVNEYMNKGYVGEKLADNNTIWLWRTNERYNKMEVQNGWYTCAVV